MSDYQTVQEVKGIDPALAAPFRTIVILRRKTTKTSKTGNPFLSVELGDSSGSFTANCFDGSETFKTINTLPEGCILRVAGKTEYWQDRFSPKLQAVENISAEEAAAEGLMAHLIETPPSPKKLWGHLQDGVAAIEHPQLRETVQRVLNELGEHFRKCPAAVSMHHAYYNGYGTYHPHGAGRRPAATLP